MRRQGGRDGWPWPSSPPKRPPPAHGIKVKKTGATWWGQRWIEALERMSLGYASRLARGRTYARAGRTHDLVVDAGLVTARVTGSRATPYEVTVRLGKLEGAAWERAIAAMAAKAQFAADLLAGRMPEGIDEAFRAGGASLFPEREADLVTACSCPDWANPCKHVAATHYVLGEALDRDPFLLFELRGRRKEQVLDALRAARRADGAAASQEIPKVTLRRLRREDYDRGRETLPVLALSFDAPAADAPTLRRLGAPAGWSADASPADLLAPLMRAAAERARRMALAEPPEARVPSASRRRARS